MWRRDSCVHLCHFQGGGRHNGGGRIEAGRRTAPVIHKTDEVRVEATQLLDGGGGGADEQQIERDYGLHLRALHLDGDVLVALAQLSSVDLSEGSRCNRFGRDRDEKVVDSRAVAQSPLVGHNVFGECAREGRHAVLQPGQRRDVSWRQQVGADRERLADLMDDDI